MKFPAVFACLMFSGSIAFAHCGSCGTGNAKKKTEKHSCDKSKKHSCDKDCKEEHKKDKVHKHDKKTNGHKAHGHYD